MSEPWRFACPEDHRTVRRARDKGGRLGSLTHWYRETCKQAYQRVTDLKTDQEVAA